MAGAKIKASKYPSGKKQKESAIHTFYRILGLCKLEYDCVNMLHRWKQIPKTILKFAAMQA